jgi:L-ascorbate metabolism protein UlaG (beta-lactamase superfamily)
MTSLTVTRVVHASVLIDFDGAAILTDPWFSQRPGYYWGEPLGIALADLPHLAGVAVSHDHYDHYDVAAFAAYPDKDVPMAVKRGTADKARAVGFRAVAELEPWETTTLGPVALTAAPGRHSVPEITYILQAADITVYFGGDTLLIPELSEIARRFPRIDLALLPINGLMLRPMLNRKLVMGPEEAAELCAVLRPRVAVPIHYTYTAGPFRDRVLLKYAGTPEQVVARFTRTVAERAPDTTVRVLKPGAPLHLTASRAT